MARYPATNGTVVFRRENRAVCQAAGTVDGSIIAAVIVTQIPRYQPRPPRSVPGPASIPLILTTESPQAVAAPATSKIPVRLRVASPFTPGRRRSPPALNPG